MVDSPAQRAFLKPSDGELSNRTVRRYHGSCTMPVRLRHEDHVDHELSVRCRSCPGCLRARQHLWRLRAEVETLLAPKTWMFTGTFASQTHDRQEVADEVTRYLKRLRRRLPPGSVRYLFCFERHKSGAWHTHALLHTRATWAEVSEPWTAGFSVARLIRGPQGANYVTKYVAKDICSDEEGGTRPRIRASRNPRYGDLVMCHEEAVVQMLAARPDNLQTTWRKNLRALMRIVDEPERDQLWQIAQTMMAK